MITFGHSGACGDLICGLPTMKALGGGALRISRREFRQFSWYRQLIPQFRELLIGQSYVDDVLEWTGEPVEYNLDDFRLNVRSDPSLHLVDCHARCFDLVLDKTDPWLTVAPLCEADIVVSRSTRFHDGPFNWSPLVPYSHRCVFIGFPDEYEEFQKISGIRMPYLDHLTGGRTDLFLLFARIIKGSKLFVGNSSFFWTLAEALKVNRVMDVYHGYPNCLPQTKNGWTELSLDIIERCLSDMEGCHG